MVTAALSYLCPIQAQSTKTINISLSEDTYVEQGYPTTSPWNNRNFYVGWDDPYNKKRTRSFVKFKLNELKNNCIFPTHIKTVNFHFYQY